ncbi:MAG: hypothetical protein PHW73_00515 [Atribacterota bacterium]|nr:hypothetical protein [Atribacterota bacterium]
MKFKKGDIVVAISEQVGCQGTIIHKGAIVKVIRSQPDPWGEITVVKSYAREKEKHPKLTDVRERVLRLATEQENESYYKGIRNISEL